MNNRTQLQANNTSLSKHLGNLMELPNIEDVKHGLYVWKKYQKCTDIIFGNATWSSSANAKVDFWVNSEQVDLSTVGMDFFKGMTVNIPVYGSRSIMDFGEPYWTYNPAEKLITGVPPDLVDEQGFEFEILTYPDPVFVDYVVSDIANKYPEDGEQDGFWYEKANILEAGYFGFSKMDSGNFTPANNTYVMNPVQHKLGVKPKLIIVFTPYDFTTEGSVYNLFSLKAFVSAMPAYYVSDSLGGIRYNGQNSAYNKESSASRYKVDESEFYFGFSDSSVTTGYRGGIVYNWIAFA